MTMKKKSILNAISMLIGLVLMVFTSNYSLNTAISQGEEISEMDMKEIRIQEILIEHERFSSEVLLSFLNQKNLNNIGLKDSKLTKFINEEYSKSDDKVSVSIKKELIKVAEANKELYKYIGDFSSNSVFFDKTLEKVIMDLELKNGLLIRKVMSGGVVNVDSGFGFAKWFNDYMKSEKIKQTPENIKILLVQLAKNQSILFEGLINLSNETKTDLNNKISMVDNSFKELRGELIKLNSVDMKMRDVIYNKLEQNMDIIVKGMNKYSKDISMKIENKNVERISFAEKGTIALIIMSIIALIVVSWSIIISREIMGKIDGFNIDISNFFNYMNKKTKDIVKLKESEDEIGQMSRMVNSNIDMIVSNIKNEEELISNVSEVVSSIKDGDLKKRVSVVVDNELLTTLKEELNVMVSEMETKMGSDINKINEVLNDFANYEFRTRVNCPSGEVSRNIDKLGDLIQEMLLNSQLNSEHLTKTSIELKDNISELNTSSNEQAANLEEVAASVEEISGNIRNNGDKSNVLQGIAKKMGKLTEEGSEKIEEMTNMIVQIEKSQKAIDEAIKVIDQIAFKTNILSLNAAVEAATAGEHGRGFAVVATEVRTLAEKSAEAADEIKLLVSSGSKLVAESTKTSGEVTKSFGELVSSITETSEYIEEITEATNEQSLAITQIAETMNALDTMTQNNASMANRTNDIADETSEIAKTIREDIQDKEFEGKTKV